MYAVFNIIGPLILLAVLIYVTVRVWKRSPADDARSDAAARDLRNQMNREDQTRSEGSR